MRIGQADVYRVLKANKGRCFCARELESVLGLSKSSVTSSLRRMRGWRDKHFKFEVGKRNEFVYRYE